MKVKSEEYSTLKLDIEQLVEKAKGEKIELLRLCSDHSDPILNGIGQPVLSFSQDEFVGIFNYSDHFFLTPGQVFELGRFLGLKLPNIIAMMLKSEWEFELSRMADYINHKSLDLGTLLTDSNSIEKYLTDFKPNINIYQDLVRGANFVPGNYNTVGQIGLLIQDMLENRSFLIRNENISCWYSENFVTEKMLLSNISGPERDKYFQLKQSWMVKNIELGDMLLYQYEKRMLNQNIEKGYYTLFGKTEMELSDIKYLVEKYRIILKNMKIHPELSYDELEEQAIDQLFEMERERKELKNRIDNSLTSVSDLTGGIRTSEVSIEYMNSYREKYRELKTRLFKLIHPNSFKYRSSSSEKQKGLNSLWLELSYSSDEKPYSVNPEAYLYQLPDYQKLYETYIRACEILGIAPENFEVGDRLQFMIGKGTPFERVLEFLDHELDHIDFSIANLEIAQDELTNEDQAQVYRHARENEHIHSLKLNREIADLKGEAAELLEQIDKLKENISSELKNM